MHTTAPWLRVWLLPPRLWPQWRLGRRSGGPESRRQPPTSIILDGSVPPRYSARRWCPELSAHLQGRQTSSALFLFLSEQLLAFPQLANHLIRRMTPRLYPSSSRPTRAGLTLRPNRPPSGARTTTKRSYIKDFSDSPDGGGTMLEQQSLDQFAQAPNASLRRRSLRSERFLHAEQLHRRTLDASRVNPSARPRLLRPRLSTRFQVG